MWKREAIDDSKSSGLSNNMGKTEGDTSWGRTEFRLEVLCFNCICITNMKMSGRIWHMSLELKEEIQGGDINMCCQLLDGINELSLHEITWRVSLDSEIAALRHSNIERLKSCRKWSEDQEDAAKNIGGKCKCQMGKCFKEKGVIDCVNCAERNQVS